MASIRDVAQKAGVGVGTVSRVINGSGYVAEKTREKIENAIHELEYTPNELARNLFKNRTGTVSYTHLDVYKRQIYADAECGSNGTSGYAAASTEKNRVFAFSDSSRSTAGRNRDVSFSRCRVGYNLSLIHISYIFVFLTSMFMRETMD